MAPAPEDLSQQAAERLPGAPRGSAAGHDRDSLPLGQCVKDRLRRAADVGCAGQFDHRARSVFVAEVARAWVAVAGSSTWYRVAPRAG